MKTPEDELIQGATNTSTNKPFSKILEASASRRALVKGGLTAAAFGFIGPALRAQTPNPIVETRLGLTDFTPLNRVDAKGPWPKISEDYQFDVLVPWGEPLDETEPEFNYPIDPDDQVYQIGNGHDGMWFFPDPDPALANEQGILAINHEFASNAVVIGKGTPENLSDVRASQHTHGVSIVGIRKVDDKWQTYKIGSSRRIHVNTPVRFSGPAEDHELLQTENGNPPLGTVNNCGSGATPWGTYLTCEENFHGYFGATHDPEVWSPSELQSNYGFSENGFGYGWHLFDKRFDLSNPGYRNEENRFGWVVEIDPFDGDDVPVKRTALGRFRHEAACVVIGQNRRTVVYMGDDSQFQYIYKFVSDGDEALLRALGASPLDTGTLYAARFDDDNTGEWLPLSLENDKLSGEFNSLAEIMIDTRRAAELAEATPMDRPEWSSIGPDGYVYFACTNNSSRTAVTKANPEAPNRDGHIIRFRDAEHHTGLTFDWDVFLIASDTHGTEESFSDPDCIYIDPDGRLFILTDGTQQAGMNNQLLVADTVSKEVKRLFSGVTGDEMTGFTMTPNRRTLFVNLQHVGNGSLGNSDFPRLDDPPVVPRDATVVITRKDGGIIGS